MGEKSKCTKTKVLGKMVVVSEGLAVKKINIIKVYSV